MNFVQQNLESTNIIGISLRTNNKKASQEIGLHWQRFFEGNIQNKIPNKISEEIFALYTDYENDHNGDYTLIIGCKVQNFNNVPDDMVAHSIPASKFAIFTAKGSLPDSIVNTWQKIWDLNLERTYAGDFELYNEQSQRGENSEVYIHIAIR